MVLLSFYVVVLSFFTSCVVLCFSSLHKLLLRGVFFIMMWVGAFEKDALQIRDAKGDRPH